MHGMLGLIDLHKGVWGDERGTSVRRLCLARTREAGEL